MSKMKQQSENENSDNEHNLGVYMDDKSNSETSDEESSFYL